jgi:hypothetical protein
MTTLKLCASAAALAGLGVLAFLAGFVAVAWELGRRPS